MVRLIFVVLGLVLALLSNQFVVADVNKTQPQQCFADPKHAYAYLLAKEQAIKNSMININTATADQFLSLRGVGTKTAQAIIDYRTTMGRFDSIDDLTKVKGIGQTTLDANRHRLTVQ